MAGKNWNVLQSCIEASGKSIQTLQVGSGESTASVVIEVHSVCLFLKYPQYL